MGSERQANVTGVAAGALLSASSDSFNKAGRKLRLNVYDKQCILLKISFILMMYNSPTR